MHIAVAGHIKPVAGPTLAVSIRGQQRIDHLGKRLGGVVGQKRRHLLWSRGQPGQVESGPPDQQVLFGREIGSQAGSLEPGEDEVIDVRTGPGAVLHCRYGRLHDRPKRPVLPADFFPVVRGAGLSWKSLFSHLTPRPRSPHLHPRRQHRNLSRAEFRLRGHRHVFVGIADRLHDEAFVRLSRHNRRP